MSPRSFNLLTFAQKIMALQENGSHLSTRVYGLHYVKLYEMLGHYVEVWTSSHLPWEGIEKIKMLTEMSKLKPYLHSSHYDRLMTR
jgi:hypothetical protein